MRAVDPALRLSAVKRLTIVAALTALCSGSATAETMTVSVKYAPMMTSGKLMGCELIWSMIAQDYAAKQNAIINATGSIAVMRPSPTSKVVVTLKINPVTIR